MNYFRAQRPFLIPFMCENRCAPFKPPLIFWEDDFTFCDWSNRFTEYLIEYNLYKDPLHNIMLGRKPSVYLPNNPIISEERRKKQHESYSGIF
jgi:hypothetical protein